MVVLDIVFLLPPQLRARAVSLSAELATRMSDLGHGSHFRLGLPYPGAGNGNGPCEPHVSLFMLTVADDEVPAVVSATGHLAQRLRAVPAVGQEFRNNPHGAPELHFRKSDEWVRLQSAVVGAVEPLRHGRLRSVDPSGADIRGIIDDPTQPPHRRDQLIRFGYDEITESWPPADDSADRFNPHVTFAWPTAAQPPVTMPGTAAADEFSGDLTELGVFGMSPYGTCTTAYSVLPMGRSISREQIVRGAV